MKQHFGCPVQATSNVLAAQLRELERDGVLRRVSTESVPPRVDYKLGAAGEELIPVMEAMCGWGTKHLGVPPSIPRGPATGA